MSVCPNCGRRDFDEKDASTRDEKGDRIYRAYRSCLGCGEAWEIKVDPQTGAEYVVQQGNRRKR